MKKLLLSIVIVLGIGGVQAQITINNLNLQIGDSIFQAKDTTFEIDLSTAAGDLIWDFSSLEQHNLDTIIPIDPENTKYTDEYTESNIAYGNFDSTNYWVNNNDGLIYLGFGGYSSKIGDDVVFKYIPADTTTRFPIIYQNDTIKFHASSTAYFSANGNDVKKKTDIFRAQVPNAWGKAKMPLNEYEVLRVSENYNKIDSIWVKQGSSWSFKKEMKKNQHYYYFWTNDEAAKAPLLTVLYDVEQDTVMNIKWCVTAYKNPDKIKQVTNTKLIVFPNPAKNNVQILTDEHIKNIVVYDITGKAVLYSKEKILNVENLTKGTYFVSIHTDKTVYNSKLLIQK